MGGKAFSALLPHAVFPRLPTAQYKAQQRLLLPRVQAFFRKTAVPVEAPEKTDHGDLDILVLDTLKPDERGDYDFDGLRQALGAEVIIRATGNRTSNFAVPLPRDYGVDINAEAAAAHKYFQVDLHVCEDESEFERIKFFHSYGDMGMLLGLVGKGAGLPTGAKGLHTGLLREDHDAPIPPRFELCADFRMILPFFGLTYSRWEEGFTTKQDLSDWIMSSRFFDPRTIHDPSSGANSRKDRSFYHDFIAYATSIAQSAQNLPPPHNRKAIREEAIDHFGKRAEWESVCAEYRAERIRLDVARQAKELLSAAKVIAWTGTDKANWRMLKNVIRMVRAEFGGEEKMVSVTEEEVKAAVMRVMPEAEAQTTKEWEEWMEAKEMEKAASKMATLTLANDDSAEPAVRSN